MYAHLQVFAPVHFTCIPTLFTFQLLLVGCAKLFLELPLLIIFRVIQLPWRGKEINGCCFDHDVMSLDQYLVSQKSLPYIVHFSGYVMNNYVVLVAISILHVHLMCVQISFGSYR